MRFLATMQYVYSSPFVTERSTYSSVSGPVSLRKSISVEPSEAIRSL